MKNFHEYTQPGPYPFDVDRHCLTCSDEAITVRVQRIDPVGGIAFVEIDNQVEEVDMTLVEDVVPGDLLLIHGGVAIARLEEGDVNVN